MNIAVSHHVTESWNQTFNQSIEAEIYGHTLHCFNSTDESLRLKSFLPCMYNNSTVLTFLPLLSLFFVKSSGGVQCSILRLPLNFFSYIWRGKGHYRKLYLWLVVVFLVLNYFCRNAAVFLYYCFFFTHFLFFYLCFAIFLNSVCILKVALNCLKQIEIY